MSSELQAADHYKSTLVSAQDSGDEIMERRSRDNILRVTRALEQGSSIPIEVEDHNPMGLVYSSAAVCRATKIATLLRCVVQCELNR
jgi:hypothetical protein